MRTGHPPALALSLVAALNVPAHAVEARGDDDPPIEVLVEIRIGRLARQTVAALRDGETVLLPAAMLLELGEVACAVDSTGRLRATRQPGGRPVEITAGSDTAFLDARPVLLDQGSVVWQDEALYVAAPTLEQLFGLIIRTEWSELAVTVVDPEALPVGRRLRREAERRAALARANAAPPDLALGPERGRLDGLVADWSLAGTLDDLPGTAAYGFGLAGEVLGGSLTVTTQSVGRATDGRARVDATYLAVWRDRPWIRQLQLGDGFATGPRFRTLRGVAATNAPYLRPPEFGVADYSGRVGPGWDVELRQSGRLLDVSRADESGAFAFDVPVRYGDNPIEVVAFGPHGEVITSERLIRLPSNRLQGGRFEWGASAGDCRSSRCRATGNLDARYGISDRWTVRAGLDGFWRDTLPDLGHVYGGVSGAITPAWQVTAEGVTGAFARGIVAFEPSPHLRARAAQTWFTGSTSAPVLHDAARRRTTEAQAFWRPLPRLARWFLEGGLVREELSTGTLTLWSAGQSLQLGAFRLDGGVRHEASSAAVGPRVSRDLQSASVTALLRNGQRHGLWARAEFELEDASRLFRWRAQIAQQLSQAWRVEAAAAWVRGVGASLTLTATAYLPGLRSVTQLFASEDSETRVAQVLQGTAQWDRATGGIAFGPGPGLDRGGLAGHVFLDANANGVRDEGERGLGGVRLFGGTHSVVTDTAGRYRVWDLVPFEPLRLTVDSLSIDDPRRVPRWGSVEVHVSPASYRRLDIPIATAGEVSGRVMIETSSGTLPAPGVRLELVNRVTGELRSLETFSDGEFYVMGVKPGSWRLRIASGQLDGLGLRAEPASIRLELAPTPGGPWIAGLQVKLVPES